MVIDLDFGTAFLVGSAIVTMVWGLLKLMFIQFEKNQKLRFEMLGATMSEQKNELDAHMKKQDLVLAEVRKVETNGMTEISKVRDALAAHQASAIAEANKVKEMLVQYQLEAANRFMTKEDAKNRHQEILDAIQGLASRIDRFHGTGAGMIGV